MSPKVRTALSRMNAEYNERKRVEITMNALDLAYDLLNGFDGDGLENISIEFLSRPGRGEVRKKDVFLSNLVAKLQAIREEGQGKDGQ